MLRGVSFEARSSRVTIILGPNGAGKTTLLRVLSGIYRVDRGEVRITGLEPRVAARRGLLALAPDEVGLYPRLTGREHLELIEGVYGCRWSGLEDAVDALSLRSVWERRVGEYSRGMRRKLALLMALSSCAPVLLLDEPLSGLDLASIHAAIELLRGVARQEGRSVLVTTHEVWLADRLGNDIVVLEEGRVVLSGELRSLLEEEGVTTLEELLLRRVYGRAPSAL